MTPAELRLWSRLKNKALEGLRFRRQAPLGPYIVDFFELKLVVEIDGGGHNRATNQRADAERTRWLERQGCKVLRFTNQEVMKNANGVCEAVLAEVPMDRARPLPKPPSAV